MLTLELRFRGLCMRSRFEEPHHKIRPRIGKVAAASAEFAAGLQTSGYIIKSPWFSLAEYRYSTSLLGQKLLDCHRVLPNHVGAERKQIEVEMVLSDKAFH